MIRRIFETVSVDALRQGFARDRFDKIRAYYGSKYTDYLAALGVKSSWSISEEPEVIGKGNKNFQYRTISATAQETVGEDTNVGDPAGYFNAMHSMKLRNTFAPEHGLIVFVSACRMDIPNTAGNVNPILSCDGAGCYYTPEFETRKKQNWDPQLFGDANLVTGETRFFENYRKPSHQVGASSNADYADLYFATYADANATPNTYRTPPLTATADLFTGNMGGSQSVEYCQYATHRLSKQSPVRPPAQISGVS